MSEMKDSGIEWIGKIPEHWEPTRLKFITKIRKEKDFMPENACYIGLENIKSGYNELIDTETTYDEGKQSICKTGDVLFNKLRPYLNKVFIAPYDAYCTNELLVFSDYLGSKKYLRYLMSSQLFIEKVMSITEGTKMPRADGDEILSFWIINPPLEEQQQIVSYLDVRCSKIDGAIAQRKAIIEKLKDYKSAVITKAVTKGLNPNVEMKDSGVKFIKNIPNKWNVKRLKFILSKKLRYGASESGVEYNSNLPRYIRITDIDENGCLKNEGKLSLTEEAAKNYILEEDCILLARSGATVGKTFLYTMEMPRSAFAGYLIQAIPNGDEITPKFFMYYTNSNPYWMWIGYIFEQATIMNVSAEKYQNLYVCYPSVSEQNDIVAYLDSQCAKIDEAIEKQEQAVAKLEEYRKSIIYYAVTGKIDCRDI